METNQTSFSTLHKLARQALEANCIRTSRGAYFRAGGHQFASLWTRDFCLAVPGILACGSAKLNAAVRDHLSRLLDNLHPEEDLVPRMFDSSSSALRVVVHTALRALPLQSLTPPLREPLRVEYLGEHRTRAMDSNILVLLASSQYLKASGDQAWGHTYSAAFLRAWRFYEKHTRDGLILQGRYEDWQDSAERVGSSSYLNLMYYIFCAEGAESLGITLETAYLHRLRTRILEHFFHPTEKLFRSLAGRPEIGLDSNLLAITSGFWEKPLEQWELLKQHPLWKNFELPGCPSFPPYPEGEISFGTRFVGLRHYHDGLLWTWLIAQAAKAAYTVGDKDEAEKILGRLELAAKSSGAIFEVLENSPSLKPFETLLYRSESPFTWGAGKILEALDCGARQKSPLV